MRVVRRYFKVIMVLALPFLVVAVLLLLPYLQVVKEYVELKASGRKTVADRLLEFGGIVEQRLAPSFKRADVSFPPDEIVFLAMKDEKKLHVYARSGAASMRQICSYPILAASGKAGPKLQEGDRQVPEGIYGIESLNPNSLYHLSMKVSYPNAFDRENAVREGRTNLGGDIMIHGNQFSIGCLAIGDLAAEDLFVLVAKTGLNRVKVIISPIDFRVRPRGELSAERPWIKDLYDRIAEAMQAIEENS